MDFNSSTRLSFGVMKACDDFKRLESPLYEPITGNLFASASTLQKGFLEGEGSFQAINLTEELNVRFFVSKRAVFVVQDYIDEGTYSTVYLVRQYATKKFQGHSHLSKPVLRALKVSKKVGASYEVERDRLGDTPPSIYLDRFLSVFRLRVSNYSVGVCRYYPLTLDAMGPKLLSQALVLNKLFLDMSRGLRVLHSQRLLHTDIKPNNVLVSSAEPKEATGVLTDFGGVRKFDDYSHFTPTTHFAYPYAYHAPAPINPSYSFYDPSGCLQVIHLPQIEVHEGVLGNIRSAWIGRSWVVPNQQSDLYALGRTMEDILRASLGLPNVLMFSYTGPFTEGALSLYSKMYPNQCHYQRSRGVETVYVHKPLKRREEEMLERVGSLKEKQRVKEMAQVIFELQKPPGEMIDLFQVITCLAGSFMGFRGKENMAANV